MLLISDEANDRTGEKGDIYKVFETLEEVKYYQIGREISFKRLTGLDEHAMINRPFLMIDSRLYFLENWDREDFSSYSVIKKW